MNTSFRPRVLSPQPSTTGNPNILGFADVRTQIQQLISEEKTITSRSLKEVGITSLRKADLHGLNLTDADLANFDLTEINLNQATLVGAHLEFANLTRADLSAANLAQAHLQNANLTDAQLPQASLEEADLTAAILYQANLSHASLDSAILLEANLECANLEGARLLGTNLHTTNLRYANMKDCDFRYSENISKILLSDSTTIGWSDAWLKSRLSCAEDRDHTFNDVIWSEGTIFNLINSLPDTHHISLLEQIAKAILEHPDADAIIEELQASLSNNLFRATAYTDPLLVGNDNVRKLSDKVLSHVFQTGETIREFNTSQIALHRAILPYLESQIQNGSKEVEQNNTLFQCWFHILSKSNDQDILEEARTVKKSLFQSEFLRQLATEHQKDDCLDEAELLRARLLFTAGDRAVAIYDTCFDTLIFGQDVPNDKDAFPLSMFFYERENEFSEYKNRPFGNILKHLEPWPLLADKALERMGGATLSAIIRRMFPMPDHPGFYDMFRKTIGMASFEKETLNRQERSEQKMELLTDGDQVKLRPYMEALFIYKEHLAEPELNSHFLESIFQITELENATPSEQAFCLLVLSTVLAKWNSAGFFGDDNESPQLLRIALYAAINSYKKLNAKVVSDEVLQGWINRSTGMEKAFTCAQILFHDMRDELQKLAESHPEFEPIFAIIPRHWP